MSAWEGARRARQGRSRRRRVGSLSFVASLSSRVVMLEIQIGTPRGFRMTIPHHEQKSMGILFFDGRRFRFLVCDMMWCRKSDITPKKRNAKGALGRCLPLRVIETMFPSASLAGNKASLFLSNRNPKPRLLAAGARLAPPRPTLQ